MKRTVVLTGVSAALCGALAGVWFGGGGGAGEPSSVLPPTVQAQDRVLSAGFAPVVKMATPAVVNISAVRIIRARQSPVDEFFRGFFGNRFPGMEDRRAGGLGSGVIVSPDGYILTNNHVVESANEVKISMADRREFPAKIVGTDPQTDIAVLKINARNLPSLKMSDSSQVQVGDLCLAIGNPFGIGQTVTMGIIGAKGRSGLGIETYEDFIQTDAAINPGNSGGALINTSGQLIGINTAILAGGGGGNQGIGFAIPINMAREVSDQLIQGGKVTRGYIGINVQELTPTLARGFGLEDTSGVVVTQLDPDGPAARASLQPGDVIQAIGEARVTDQNSFRFAVSRGKPGSTVKVRVARDGKSRDVPVTLARMQEPEGANGRAQEEEDPELRSGRRTPLSGVAVTELTPQLARRFRLPARSGVIVTEVDAASPAASAGLSRGDVIQEVNRQPVASLDELEAALRKAGNGPVILFVNRGGRTAFLSIEGR